VSFKKSISLIDTQNRISSIQKSQLIPLALSEQLNKTFLINRLLPQVWTHHHASRTINLEEEVVLLLPTNKTFQTKQLRISIRMSNNLMLLSTLTLKKKKPRSPNYSKNSKESKDLREKWSSYKKSKKTRCCSKLEHQDHKLTPLLQCYLMHNLLNSKHMWHNWWKLNRGSLVCHWKHLKLNIWRKTSL
jgi:hypothetical protein